MSHDELPLFQVDCRALAMDGPVAFADLAMGTVIELPDTILGIPAGYWEAGPWQHSHGSGGRTRSLTAATDHQVAKAQGGNRQVPTASVAPDWSEPRPEVLEGMRLSELRDLIELTADMDGDTLVVAAPADHPSPDRYSPLARSHYPGLYAPDTTGGGNYGSVYAHDEADQAPSGSVPALIVSPSN